MVESTPGARRDAPPPWEDVATRPILKAAAALAIVIAAVAGGCALLWHLLGGPAIASLADPANAIREAVPEPRLQSAPQSDLDAYRADEDSQLRRYVWIDPEHRFAAIPIERAMALLLSERAAAATDMRGKKQ